MAEFNSCATLMDNNEEVVEILDKFNKSQDPLQDMLDMQNFLQETLSKRLPEFNIKPNEVKTKGQLIEWLDSNFDAIMDEYRELKNAVGGMSHGEKNASAVWKKWKSNHGEMIEDKITDMSKEDNLEMLFEMIDIMHFVFNMLLGLGLSSQDVYLLYMLKNKENFNRYTKRQY